MSRNVIAKPNMIDLLCGSSLVNFQRLPLAELSKRRANNGSGKRRGLYWLGTGCLNTKTARRDRKHLPSLSPTAPEHVWFIRLSRSDGHVRDVRGGLAPPCDTSRATSHPWRSLTTFHTRAGPFHGSRSCSACTRGRSHFP